MTESASATFSAQSGSGSFQYSLTLKDTGTTAIGTFWFAWVPGKDFMNVSPTAIAVPTGWTDTITGGGPGDGYAIQFEAGSSSFDLQSGASLSGFGFTSTEVPAALSADSNFYPTTPTTTSFVYSGGPFSDPGFQFALTQACYRAGTRIRTPGGEVPVEALRPGDPVVVSGGAVRPVRWIGRRAVDCARHPRKTDVWPIRIAARALAPSVPARDLYVSPDHALFLGGVLVPAKCLVNGATIVQEPADAVVWHHIELETHDIVFAEGAAAETYLDCGDRATFDGGAGAAVAPAEARQFVALAEARQFGSPAEARQFGAPFSARHAREALCCAELVVSGPVLAAIRRGLAARAASLVRVAA